MAYEEWDRKRRDDPRTTWELINCALTETNDAAAWEPVELLHFRATREVFDAARRLCASQCAKELTALWELSEDCEDEDIKDAINRCEGRLA